MSAPVFDFTGSSIDRKLDVIYNELLNQRDGLMALQDQIARLTEVVNGVRDKQAAQSQQLADLQNSVDAEQAQVKDAVGLLTQPNPDLEAAIATLQGVDTNLGAASDTIGTIKADVESTIPDAPPA